MTLISTMLILLILGICSLMPIILFFEYFVRPNKMRKLANKYGLTYEKHTCLINDNDKRNIIKGHIGRNKIELFDTSLWDNGIYRKHTRTKRMTTLIVNKKRIKIRSFLSGYGSINKINKMLLRIKNNLDT